MTSAATAPTPFGRVWRLLTEPSPRLGDPEDRRRARLLSSVLVGLVPLSFAAALLSPIFLGKNDPWSDPTTRIGVPVAFLGILAYGLSRTRFYLTAATTTVALASVGTWGSVAVSGGTAHADASPYFLGVAVLIASIFLPVDGTVVLAVGNLAALFLLPRLVPAFAYIDVPNSASFLLLVSVFIVIFALVRRQDLLHIQEQADTVADREREIRGLFDSTFEGVLLHEAFVVVEANQAAGLLLGRTPRELVGTSVVDLFEPAVRERIGDAVRTGTDSVFEVDVARTDGSTVALELTTKPHQYRGRPAHLVAMHDVTERRRAAEARRAAEEKEREVERLRAVDRFKTQFIHTLSHELNTPLTPIQTEIYLLREQLGPLNDRQKEAVDMLGRNVDRLARLVHDVLDLARLQGGTLRVEPEPSDVATVVREASASFAAVARDRGIAFDVTVDGDLPVLADPQRVSQVLFNLIGNALKFTPTGGRVQVDARREGAVAVVRVRDTGVGFTPEERERLFQPFGQLERHGEVPEVGTGLGLYISRGFLEAQGGAIWAESPGPGRGAVFGFSLPLRPPDT